MPMEAVRSTAARAIAQAALQIALGYAAAHIREEGGNNRGDQVEFFQRLMGGAPGDPWCADFVCTCLVKAYARCTGQDESRWALPGFVHAAGRALLPLSGYCPALAEAARTAGLLRRRGFAALPGDLVLFDFEGSGEPHHAGFVRAPVSGAGVPEGAIVLTVEGNTSAGPAGAGGQAAGQADGDGVYLRTRACSYVFGYVHFA
jgi:hypothetical protein